MYSSGHRTQVQGFRIAFRTPYVICLVEIVNRLRSIHHVTRANRAFGSIETIRGRDDIGRSYG